MAEPGEKSDLPAKEEPATEVGEEKSTENSSGENQPESAPEEDHSPQDPVSPHGPMSPQEFFEQVMQEGSPRSAPPSFNLVKASVYLYGIMTLIGLIWLYFQDAGWELFVAPLSFSRQDWAFHLGVGIFIGLAAVLITRASVTYAGVGGDMERRFKRLLGDLTLPQIFLLAVLSGVGEEVLFRGAMQPVLGLFWTSLTFGSLHFMPPMPTEEDPHPKLRPRDFTWTAFAIIMGFVLGYSYQVTGNIATPITAHFTVNFLNFIHINSLVLEDDEG